MVDTRDFPRPHRTCRQCLRHSRTYPRGRRYRTKGSSSGLWPYLPRTGGKPGKPRPRRHRAFQVNPSIPFPSQTVHVLFRREHDAFSEYPYCQIHEQRGHATFMCPYWSCPMCERLNPRHPPQLCPGIGTDEEDQPRPWNQEGSGLVGG